MRKLIVLVVGLAMTMLVACSDEEGMGIDEDLDISDENESEIDSDNPTHEPDGDVDEGPTTDDPSLIEGAGTDDPLEFMEYQGDLLFQDGMNEYELKNLYVSDETDDDGFTTYEDGDFEIRYAIAELQNVADGIEDEGNSHLAILGETINDTDEDYSFGERIRIKTDEKEEAETSFGLNGAGSADQKEKFNDHFELEYDIPDEFAWKLYDPSLHGDTFDDIVFGDDWDRKYDEAFEEFEKEHTVQELEFHKE